MNTQKGFAPVLIVLIVAVILGGGYVAVSQYSKDKVQKAESSLKDEVTVDNSITFTPTPRTVVPVTSLFLPIPKGNGAGHIYKVGTVTSGIYAGGDVWFVTTPGEMGGDNPYHLVNKDGKMTLIAKNSNDLYSGDYLDESKFNIDSISVLSSLNFPEKISYNGLNFTLGAMGWLHNPGMFFDDIYKPGDFKLAFTDPKLGDFYMDTPGLGASGAPKQNGFYVKAPNGTVRTYTLDIGFYDANHNLPKITWSDGSTNISEYVNTDRGGCGSSNYAAVVYGLSVNDLVVIGKTSGGDSVYGLKDSNGSILQKIYKNDYNPYNAPKLSYAEFVAARPAFFWFDAFGRLIKFQRADFVPQAECGKPVIYLYPEKTTKVTVQVEPKGGFSKTEPEYGSGWDVIATTDSQITEIKTGKIYPYLFWEGRGGIYATPEKGFVVAAQDVHSFLVEKLTKLGLNQKEQADFIEFWEPHMTGAPYFFVTFLGNQAMDAIAPLTVVPKPDSVIRILMDFSPLQKPISVEGFEIRTPERTGFTVVEWGGVLR